MPRRFAFAFLLCILLAPLAAHGEVRPALGPELVFEDLVAEALQKNPEISAARRRAEAARQRIPQERSFEDPEVGVTQWSIPSNFNLLAADETWWVVQQKFPFFGKRDLRAEVARKEADKVLQELRSAELSVQARVTQAYYELFFAHKALQIHHQHVDLLRKFARIAEEKFSVGRASQHDLLKAQIELADLSNTVLTLQQELEAAEARVNTLLDRPADSPLGAPQEPKPKRLAQTLEELQRGAMERRPELLATAIAIEQGERALALAKRNYRPDFMLEAAYWDVHDGPSRWMATVMINIPWINKRRYDAEIAERRAELAASQNERRQAANEAQFAVKELFVKIQSAERLVDLLGKSILPLSEQNADAAILGYQSDKVDFLTAIEAERDLLKFRLDFYRALADLEKESAELGRFVGF